MQQLTSLNKEQQLPVSYRAKDKLSEYQLQLFRKQQESIPLSTDENKISNNDEVTQTKLKDINDVEDEISRNVIKGLNLIELNNNKPQTLNKNLGEDGSCATREKDDGKFVVPVTENKHHKTLTASNSMGSNVSRYSEKGLSGRRAHSSGNLFSGTNTANGGNNATNTPSKKAHNKKFNNKKKSSIQAIPDDLSDVASISTTIGVVTGGGGCYDNASFTDPCIVNDISLQQLYSPYNSSRAKSNVSKQQKQAYHGSLPNNLDDPDDEDVVDGVLNQQRGECFLSILNLSRYNTVRDTCLALRVVLSSFYG